MMRAYQQPLLGILGGMGPLATVDFLGKLTGLTSATCDQDHLPWITVSQPGMPDRSRAIEQGDDAPLAYLRQGVAWLAEQGVQLIAIPCSTSHYWFELMQAACPVPILHIADASVEELRLQSVPAGCRVAVLATRGTVASGIYHQRLSAAGFDVPAQDDARQREVDLVIADVKAGRLGCARERMQHLQQTLTTSGAQAVVLACTELPLAQDAQPGRVPVIDASLALARASLRRLAYLRD